LTGYKDFCYDWISDIQEPGEEQEHHLSQFLSDQATMFDDLMIVCFYQHAQNGDMKKCAGINVKYRCRHYLTIICPPPDLTM